MIDLEPAFRYLLEVEGPLAPKDGAEPDTRRQYWLMASATLDGPKIRARTPMPGIDWFSPYPDGFGRPHVRLPFQTDDGALVLLEYRGIVQSTEAFLGAVKNDKPTRWEDQYMRMALCFDTSSERYAWLTESLFVARGRLLGAKRLEYDVYRVR